MLKNLGWKAYFILFCMLSVGNLVSLFDPESPPYIYYHIFMAFHKATGIFYYLNIVSAALTILTAIPVFLCIFGGRWLNDSAWKVLFILRVIFDLLGRGYEFIFLKSLWIDEPRFGLAYLFSIIGLLLPSYWLLFRYAFCRKCLPASDSSPQSKD